MIICSQCNTTLPDGTKFCPVCGMDFKIEQCPNCGSIIPAGTKFCTRCGAQQNVQRNCPNCNSPLERNSKFCGVCGNSTQTPQDAQTERYAVRTLVFGILGLAFATTFYLSFLGIIFSAISKGNLKKYLFCSGVLKDGRAKVGKGLSTAGLIVGIIFTALLAFVIVAIACDLFNYSVYDMFFFDSAGIPI